MKLDLKAPLDIQIELTDNCNQRCIYCYNASVGTKLCDSLSSKEIDRIAEQIISNDIFDVILTGGEPLMAKETLCYALQKFTGHNSIDVYINTNLSMPINEEYIDKIGAARSILVSFPSYRQNNFKRITKNDNYDIVLKNLDSLINSGANIAVNCVVSQLNKSEVYDTARFLADRGITRFCANPINPSKKEHINIALSKQEIIELAETLVTIEKEMGLNTDFVSYVPRCMFPEHLRDYKIAKHGCGAGITTLTINPRGDIKKCSSLNQVYGNLIKEELSTIWKRVKSDVVATNPQCDGCNISSSCSQGCISRRDCYSMEYDPLIAGPIKTIIGLRQIDNEHYYSIREIKSRAESKEELLITTGNSIMMINKDFLEFIDKLKEVKFNFNEVNNYLGDTALELLKALYYGGFLKDAI